MKSLKSLIPGLVIVNGVSVGHEPIEFEDDVVAHEHVQESIKRGEIEIVKATTPKVTTDKKVTVVSEKKETAKAEE